MTLLPECIAVVMMVFFVDVWFSACEQTVSASFLIFLSQPEQMLTKIKIGESKTQELSGGVHTRGPQVFMGRTGHPLKNPLC